MQAEVKFMSRTAGYTQMNYKKNLQITKELNVQPITEFKKITDLTRNPMFFECPC